MHYVNMMCRFNNIHKTAGLFLSLLVVLLVGCQSKEARVPDGFASKPIPFLNKNAYIPSDYEKINLNELGGMIRQNPDIDPIIELYYNMAKSVYATDKIAPVLYAENGNLTNCIWFVPSPYTPLTEEIVSFYTETIDNSLSYSDETNGITSKKIESSFKGEDTWGTLKLKYFQTAKENKKYLTQYITTKDLETFIIVVLNSENEDFAVTQKSL